MKVMRCVLLLFFFPSAWAQTNIPVSSTGIGEIKVNMSLAQVEKIIGKSIALNPPSEAGYYLDTVVVMYKTVQLTIEFFNGAEEENQKAQKKVYGISASHAGLQTRSGITLGSNKFEIVKKLDGMYLTLQPDWRMEGKPAKEKYSVLMLTDGENGTQLFMYFEDNLLTGFYVSIYEGC